MKLTLMGAIEVLLENGSISVKENQQGTKRQIKVCKPNPLIKGTTYTVGEINQKTLITLLNTEFVKLTQGTKKDKYGNTYWYYESNIQKTNHVESGKGRGK